MRQDIEYLDNNWLQSKAETFSLMVTVSSDINPCLGQGSVLGGFAAPPLTM